MLGDAYMNILEVKIINNVIISVLSPVEYLLSFSA